jgi:hypothetical protein
MKRSFLLFALVALAIALVSCSGKSSATSPPMPNISGSWEFIAASTTNPGYSTGIELALQEGQVFVNGAYQESGQISASGLQINFVGFTPTGGIVFGGNCAVATDNPGNGLVGSISGVGGSMNFTYTQNGNVFTVIGTLDPSGQSIDSGTYTEQSAPAGESNGACNGNSNLTVIDAGTITGGTVPKLSGTYAGQVCQPLDPSCTNSKDTATATLSQSGATLTVSLMLTGADNSSFNLTGPVTGNSFSVQGTFQGQSVAYYGYYDLTHGSANSSVYLVNATDSAQSPAYAGTLAVQ